MADPHESLLDWFHSSTNKEQLAFGKTLCRYGRKVEWRRGAQRRASQLAIVLKAVGHAGGKHFRKRERTEDGRWRFIGVRPDGTEVTLAFVAKGGSHTLAEMLSPVDVEVLEPTLMDMVFLAALAKIDGSK